MQIIGLDHARTTGVAICETAPRGIIRLRDAKVYKVKNKDGESNGFVWIRYESWLSKLIVAALTRENSKVTPHVPRVIVGYEEQYPGSKGSAHHALKYKLIGLTELVCDRFSDTEVMYEGVGVMSLKKFATGRGGAGKEDMVDSANNFLCTTNLRRRLDASKTGDHDIADAIHILRFISDLCEHMVK